MFPLPPPPPTPQAAPTLSDALYGSLENSKRKESTINFDYATKAEDEDDLTSPTSPTQHLASLSPAEQVHHLIVLQDFEGFWVLNRDVDTILALKDDGKNGTWKDFHSGTEWITVLVIVFLRVKMAGEKEVWELIVDKALEWLSTRGAEVKEKKLFEEAERLFSQ